MNYRLLVHRLTIAVAIGMIMAALSYRSDAQSQSAAIPPVPESNQDQRHDNDDKKAYCERLRQLQLQMLRDRYDFNNDAYYHPAPKYRNRRDCRLLPRGAPMRL